MKEQKVIYVPINDFNAPFTAVMLHHRVKSIKKRAKSESRMRYALRWVMWKVYNALVALEHVKLFFQERKLYLLDFVLELLKGVWFLVKMMGLFAGSVLLFHHLGALEHGWEPNRLPTALVQALMLLTIILVFKMAVNDQLAHREEAEESDENNVNM